MNYTNASRQSVGYEDIEKTVHFLRERVSRKPVLSMICGSGLGSLAEAIQEQQIFEYKDIPNFLVGTVSFHAGRLIFGKLGGKDVVCMQGRFHGYEGYHMTMITFPIRVMAELGAKVLVVTNACGGLNTTYQMGDIMVMKDHINIPGLAGVSPLVGTTDVRFGPRFVPLSAAYHKKYRDLAKKVAVELEMDYVKEGVYVMQAGPCFETVTECRLLRLLGADVTGMSSVPEVIVARQIGMEVMGISLVTNMCISEYDSVHVANVDDVLETGRMRATALVRFITRIVEDMEIA